MSNSTEIKTRTNKAGKKRGELIISLPIDDIVKLYKNGVSENKIAQKFQVGRGVIRKRLILANVYIRTQSEAELLKWSQMTAIQKISQTREAHITRKGQIVSWETKCLHAKTIQKFPSNVSNYETILEKMLCERGINTIPQQAIGAYNCDLAAYPIAMEVWGGNWHFSGKHFAIIEERFRYILNSGWFIYVVICNKSFPLTNAVADEVAAYIQRIRRHKPTTCKYRVVWGANDFITKGSANDEHISIVQPFTNRRNPITGLYERIPR